MIRRLLPHPLLSLFLLLVWLALVNSAAPGAMIMGAVVGVTIPRWTTRFWPASPRLYRPRQLLWLVPVVLWDILVSNVSVAWIVLARANRTLCPVFLEIDLEIRDPHGIVAFASIISLTPGTVSVQLSRDRRVLHVHCLDCPDPEASVRRIKRRYEQPLRRLLEC